jgi:hypothetical protein
MRIASSGRRITPPAMAPFCAGNAKNWPVLEISPFAFVGLWQYGSITEL